MASVQIVWTFNMYQYMLPGSVSSIWKWINSNQAPKYNAWATSRGEPHSGSGMEPLAVLYRSYGYEWVDVTTASYHKYYSICQLTNQTIIDDLDDVPIAPHHMNDTGM